MTHERDEWVDLDEWTEWAKALVEFYPGRRVDPASLTAWFGVLGRVRSSEVSDAIAHLAGTFDATYHFPAVKDMLEALEAVRSQRRVAQTHAEQERRAAQDALEDSRSSGLANLILRGAFDRDDLATLGRVVERGLFDSPTLRGHGRDAVAARAMLVGVVSERRLAELAGRPVDPAPTREPMADPVRLHAVTS